MVDLAHDIDRVAHVPGVLRRRALMVSLHASATDSLLRHNKQHGAAVDASLSIHDAAALFPESSETQPHVKTLSEVARISIAETAKSKDDEDCALAVRGVADVFITAAAVGNTALLETLLEKADSHLKGIAIDFAKLVEVAALNGHRATVAWLWALTTNREWRICKMPILRRIDPIKEAIAKGAQQAVDILQSSKTSQEMVDHIRKMMHFDESPPDIDREPATEKHHEEDRVDAGERAKSNATTIISETDPPAELQVLTNRALMAVVGNFQESPRRLVGPLIDQVMKKAPGETDPPLLAVAQLAIIGGDLFTLKAACLLSKARPRDMPLLLHFAACEGQFEMVCWLHSQFTGDITCRPDTMAMAVRCGWAPIVQWLHEHCPESAQTMSEHALNDAARWGHVDVLRVCHTLHLRKDSPAMLSRAVCAGQLEVVKLLHALDWHYDHETAMIDALQHGHLPIIQWLHSEDSDGQCLVTEEAVSTERLLRALCLNTTTAEATVQFVWSLIDPASEIVARCMCDNVKEICAKACKTTLVLVLPLIPPESDAAFEGLLSATRAARLDSVELLLQHWTPRDPCRVDTLLKTALYTDNSELMKWYITQDCVQAENLETLLLCAVQKQRAFAKFSVPSWLNSVTSITVDTPALTTMTAIHARLQQLQPDTDRTLEIERELLVSVPERIYSRLLDIWISEARPLEPDETEITFVVTHKDGVVVVAKEYALETFPADVTRFELCCTSAPDATPASPFCGVQAARTGNLKVLRFLYEHRLLPVWVLDAVRAVAHEHGQLEVLTWLASVGESIASPRGLRLAMKRDQKELVGSLIERLDNNVDAALCEVLREELHADVQYGGPSVGCPIKRKLDHSKALGWAMSLLQRVLQKRPDQRHALLAVAAEAGSLAMVEYVLGTRCGKGVVLEPGEVFTTVLIAAASSANEALIKYLYEQQSSRDWIDVQALRRCGGLARVGAVQTLLTYLRQWNLWVREQLENERGEATKLFGLPRSGKQGLLHNRHVVTQARPPRRRRPARGHRRGVRRVATSSKQTIQSIYPSRENQ